MGGDNNNSNAKSRLDQVGNHISPDGSTPPPRPGPKRSNPIRKSAPLPADWSDVISEMDLVRKLGETPNSTSRGYQRHKEAGKLWVRERIELLCDKGSFREVGSLAGTVTWKYPEVTRDAEGFVLDDKGRRIKRTPEEEEKQVVDKFTPSNNVQGFGKVRGRNIILTADDFTIRAGHADGALMPKTLYMDKMSIHLRIPKVNVVDGASGGGSITTYRKAGGSYLPKLELLYYLVKQLDLGIPQISAVVGPAVGLGAARAAASHFSVIAADIGSLFNAGPKIVEGATFEEDLSFDELGGPRIHCSNGTIDNVAPNEKGCYDMIAHFLSYLPNHGGEIPPFLPPTDSGTRHCPELRTIIPRRRQRTYRIRDIIIPLVDKDTWFEIGPHWGRTIVVGLARIGGYPVGIVGDDGEVNSGALDSPGAQKLMKHLKLCDVFGIPIVQLVDIPGFAVGTVAEKSGMMKWGTELFKAYHTTTIPIFSCVIRRCYGIGGSILMDSRDPAPRVAWPSLESGSIPLDGGIEVNHVADLKRAGDNWKEVYLKLEAEYLNLQNPIRVANQFGVEDIIDPADTRSLMYVWLRHMYEVNLPERLLHRAQGAIKPSFR
jgi:acetyl-CoA carboxylase carboxyltransferase component